MALGVAQLLERATHAQRIVEPRERIGDTGTRGRIDPIAALRQD